MAPLTRNINLLGAIRCGEMQPVMLARTSKGEAFALRDICPHRLVPLSAGQQVETNGQPTIQCPYHGWQFAAGGQCTHVPALPTFVPPATHCVRRFCPSQVMVRPPPESVLPFASLL